MRTESVSVHGSNRLHEPDRGGIHARADAPLPVLLAVDEAAALLPTTRRAIYTTIERHHDRIDAEVGRWTSACNFRMDAGIENENTSRTSRNRRRSVGCRIASAICNLLRNPKKTMGFHDFEEYERWLAAAQRRGPEAALMVLLGGDASRRSGDRGRV